MATLLQAINAYGPQLDLNQTAQLTQIAEWMSSRTGLNKSEIVMMLQELNDAIIYFNKNGTAVKLPGVGIFSPSIKQTGKFRVTFRADTSLNKGLNAPDAYIGPIKNAKNIGLTNAELKALWDADHPTDPLVLP